MPEDGAVSGVGTMGSSRRLSDAYSFADSVPPYPSPQPPGRDTS